MRLLVTAAGGQLGADLVRVAGGSSAGHWAGNPGGGSGGSSAGPEVVALTRAELDVTDPAAVEKAVVDVRPDLVLNAAAYTAVDAAETDEDTAALVNAKAPADLARVCALHDASLVHVSTDYVFDGSADRPYEVDAPTGPTSAYGRTKLAGEQAVRALLPERSWVVRTAWVYGESGANFVRTMVKLAAIKDTLDVVDDQRGSPTWSRDLAAGVLALAAARPAPGIYHCTNAGETTWYGLARAVFEEIGADPERVRPTTTDRFPRPAPRPAYSVLSAAGWTGAGLPAPRPWRDALHAAFAEVGDSFRS